MLLKDHVARLRALQLQAPPVVTLQDAQQRIESLENNQILLMETLQNLSDLVCRYARRG